MAAAAAAGGQRQRKRVIVVIMDKRDDYFVYNIGINHLFQPGAGAGAGSRMETRPLPRPVGQIDKPLAHPEGFDFALAADGATLVCVSSLRRTVLYDTRSGASSAGPELQYCKYGGSHVIPLGPRFYALESLVTCYEQANPAGEDCALFRPSGGSSSWRTIPEPPADLRCLNHFQNTCDLAAYFTAGARIWVSARERGTYTLDTVSRAWRKEGDWELPFDGRALVVPDMDNLCFGLSKTRRLVAVDIGKSPPLVLYRWEETFPRWLVGMTNKACALLPQGNLIYLGGGRFCIVWSGFMDDAIHGSREHFVQFIAVQLVKTSTSSGNEKKIRMVKLKACCYLMPTDGRMAQAF
uniref:Uncharacterized protein n=1 Tax=Avena sativa TaxID=4498 RepID=A0ACD5WH36_AVESA